MAVLAMTDACLSAWPGVVVGYECHARAPRLRKEAVVAAGAYRTDVVDES